MRKALFIAAAVLVFIVLNFLIYQKENDIKTSWTMYLELRPVDPRSLMQGDYMMLAYALADSISGDKQNDVKRKGLIVVALDENRVASFVRFHDEASLKDGEHLIKYRMRDSGAQLSRFVIAPESFMFQEGHAQIFQQARYAEIGVTRKGVCLLRGLADENFNTLESPD